MNELTPMYKHSLEAFTDWLGVLGYSEATQTGAPTLLAECLHWLQERELTTLHHISQAHIKAFLAEQETRPNKKRGSAPDYRFVNKKK